MLSKLAPTFIPSLGTLLLAKMSQTEGSQRPGSSYEVPSYCMSKMSAEKCGKRGSLFRDSTRLEAVVVRSQRSRWLGLFEIQPLTYLKRKSIVRRGVESKQTGSLGFRRHPRADRLHRLASNFSHLTSRRFPIDATGC